VGVTSPPQVVSEGDPKNLRRGLRRRPTREGSEASPRCRIRQHTSASVSIRQHTSLRRRPTREGSAASPRCRWPHTSAYVSIRQHTSADSPRCSSGHARGFRGESALPHTSASVSVRQRTSAYVSIRQHTSAYVSIRKHNVSI
jgi:hypothetical protein